MAKAPITELGRVGVTGATFSFGPAAWSSFVDEREYVPELVWPSSIEAFERMRTDSQLAALLAAFTLPIRRYRWAIDPNGARDVVVRGVAEDLGLPVRGEEATPRGRSRGRFSHDTHLRLALEALVYGHAYFEQTGEIGADGLWHLRKLAARPQWTLVGGRINVAPDGGLISIQQALGIDQPEIPVDRLVAYVWDQAPGNWVGRSMLRDCYRNWLLKDRLIRIDAMLHEKAGGVHIPEAPKGATDAEIRALGEMAQRVTLGLDGGGAVPAGTAWNRLGTAPADVIASIRYHDESMARRFVQMVLQLGQTERGARALGETFVDLASEAQVAAAIWYRDTTNEHVIEDWVDWNYGPGEPLCPLIVFDPPDDEALSVGDFVLLLDSGALIVDAELESYLRERFSLPEADPATARPQPAPVASPSRTPSPAAATPRRRQLRAAGMEEGTIPLPDRKLRRQPYPQEIAAAVDFASMESSFLSERAALVASWKQIQATQRDELAASIKAAGLDVAKLSAIELDAAGADRIQLALVRMAAAGAQQAIDEALRQGVVSVTPALAAVEARLQARSEAVATLFARSYGEAASRRAVALAGGSLDAEAIAGGVSDYLANLSDAYLEEQLGGALLQAQNAGRNDVFRQTEPSRIYASALLDTNTCDPCVESDGVEFETVDDFEQQFPTGGNMDCDGGPRCRCTGVAVYDESPATVQ